ncbi:MAG: hypothetical protein WKG32_03380 [Gemmatimonadaceae bacterium]
MKRRPSGFWVVSVALHVVLGAGLLYVITIPAPLGRRFRREKLESLPVERIGFLSVPNRGVNTPGRSGGDGRPERPVRRAPPIAAPSTTPSTLPPPPPSVPPSPEGGSGAVVGAGGPTKGIVPSYSDSRLWSPASPIVMAPKSLAEKLDSAVQVRIVAHLDSLAAVAPSGRKPGDWTVSRNGKKYGIDQKKIYIGNITIPTAVLALLPMNRVQGNPTTIERERVLSRMNADITYQAQQGMNDAEFKAAVKRIRERRERERREAEGGVKPITPGTTMP